MEVKKTLANVLLNVSKRITKGTASLGGFGLEEMPESMKKER